MGILATLLLALLSAGQADKPVRIALAGDSTVNDAGGWGPGFRACFTERVEVVNLARNGRSTKSFRAEGLWDSVLAARPDYVLIQFGHSDVPGKGPDRETDAATTYRENMLRFLDEAAKNGARPVLVTSIVRRLFTAEGKIKVDSLAPYVDGVRKIAAEKNVPLIDLYTLTREQAEELGPEGSLQVGRTGLDGKPDTTHLGPWGQRTIGAMVAREIQRVYPELSAYRVPEQN
jgi:lysophospholipase L1-like esterase